MCGSLSDTAVLLPGLVHHGAVWRVQGRGERAQETSQQRKAQSTPCTKHGPAIAVTDVLGYAKHVARIAGQFKVDPGHTCAEGDYAACACQTERRGGRRASKHHNPFSSALMHHFTRFSLIKTLLPLCGDSG